MSHTTDFTISEAQALFVDLVAELDHAYWEASTIEMKDHCFNTLRLIQQELDDLGKVSIQDHHYPYEVINTTPTILKDAFEQLYTALQSGFVYTKTKQALLNLIKQIQAGFKP
jgi:hypothetical protein